jgi:hypothetical protein
MRKLIGLRQYTDEKIQTSNPQPAILTPDHALQKLVNTQRDNGTLQQVIPKT